MMSRALAFAIVISAACGGGKDAPPPAPPPPVEPVRGAAGDQDLRLMLAEVAEERGCDAMKGQFRALRDRARPDVVNGVLWIRTCDIRRRGTELVLDWGMHGWQRIEQARDKAGATFEVKQDVRFAAKASIPGTVDVGYAPEQHIASLWFSPARTPDVRFSPIQEIAVEEQGAWAATVGALGSVVGQGPEDQAEDETADQGDSAMTRQLSSGLGATIDLCSGQMRVDLGRPARGKMFEPGVGESRKVVHEVHPTGLAIYGPYPAPRGMTVDLEVEQGHVRAALMCRGEAEKLGAAFVDGAPLPEVTSLVVKDVDGEATLRVGKSRCKVALVVRSIPDATGAPARFRWTRPTKEWAAVTGGPLASCR